MARVIQAFQDSSYIQEVTLDGAVYRLHIKWNHRAQHWSMDILDIDENVLVGGISLMVEYPLLFQYQYREIPPGAMAAVDPADPYTELGRHDLGSRSQLVYLTEEEASAV